MLWTPEKIIMKVKKYDCNFLQFCNYFDACTMYNRVVTALFVLWQKHKTVKIRWRYNSAKEHTWKYVIISVLKRHDILLHIFSNSSVILFYKSESVWYLPQHWNISKYRVNTTSIERARRWRHVMTLFVAVTSRSQNINEQTIVPHASFFKIILAKYFIIRSR